MRVLACLVVAVSSSIIGGFGVTPQSDSSLVSSYGQYKNADQSVERIITWNDKAYAYVEGGVSGKRYEIIFTEGPNYQRNAPEARRYNEWAAIEIKSTELAGSPICRHYFVIEVGRVFEYFCDTHDTKEPSGAYRKKQLSAEISSLPKSVEPILADARRRAKLVWPNVKFPTSGLTKPLFEKMDRKSNMSLTAHLFFSRKKV